MADSDSHFDEFPEHSRFKQLILKTYFEEWARKLLLRKGAGDVLLYVDACAGRGMDDVGNHGSPIIAAKAAAQAEGQLHSEFHRDVRVQVIAIERTRSHFEALAANLGPFGERARAVRGTFADEAPRIVNQFAGVPTLWFVDPFGIEALDSTTVRLALSGPKAEAFILFNDQGALRHFGAAVAEETEFERRVKDMSLQQHLFPDVAQEEQRRLQSKSKKSRQALQVTKEKAIEILNAALERPDWQARVAEVPRHLRAAKILEIFTEILIDCEARYTTKFPVLSADGGHMYYLIHATKNAKGRLVMKKAVEYALKHGPLPPATVAQLRAAMHCDFDGVVEFLVARLAGRRVRWARDPGDPGQICVQEFAMEETEIHKGEIPALKKLLEPYRLRSERSVVFQFPS